MKQSKNHSGFAHLGLILLFILVLAAIAGAGYYVMQKQQSNGPSTYGSGTKTETYSEREKQWLKGCVGEQRVQMQKSPMDLQDVGDIQPTGLTAGGHVTPIDHLYFGPIDFKSPRDKYPVFAMADGQIIEVSSRSVNVDSGQARPPEYRIIMRHSCQTISYFDLVTSLDKSITDQMPALKSGGNVTEVNIPIKAGQLIGRIGGQTLDTAVYNMKLRLPGLLTAELYELEFWKIHTDDFFSYFNEPLKGQLLAKNVRKVEPFGGKIDYDQPGKLIGNWFKQGTNGYAGPKETQGKPGNNSRGYWSGHLSVFYHAISTDTVIVSLGEFKDGRPQAFAVTGNAPDPAKIDKSSGATKYELIQGPGQNGQIPQGPPRTMGVALFQVLDGEKLKVEVFPDKTAAQVSGFTASAQTYER